MCGVSGFPTKSGPGEIWVCPACGRRNKDRYALGDTSCVLAAVLCLENSIVLNGEKLIKATAVPVIGELAVNITCDAPPEPR